MSRSTIAVIGAGRVGATLGSRWAIAGHDVRFGVRDPDDERHGPLRPHGGVTAVGEAVDGAEVVLLAVPGTAVLEVAAGLPALGDAVVVDATNPLASDLRTHERSTASGAERLVEVLAGGRLVKAFNTVGSGVMADTAGFEPAPTMWLAGDDGPACDLVAGLARDVGFEPVVVGGLGAALDLEHLAVVWIRLAYTLGHGPDFAISQQRRTTA